MKYKLTEDGKGIAIQDGKPVVIDDDGKEFSIDAIGANDKLKNVIKESNERRKKNGELTRKLELYKDIEDPAAALDALQKVESYDKDQQTALDNLKDTINKTWQSKQQEWETTKKDLESKLFHSNVSSKFATSEVVKKTVLPVFAAVSAYSKFFKPDGTAVDSSGNVIYSKEKPGTPADFDESLEHLINTSPEKDQIWKASGGSGSGSGPSSDGDGGEIKKTSVEKIKAGLQKRTK